MESIELRDVNVRFGRVVALDGVRITVRTGQALTLLGPNGAGKSTLIKVLLGLVRSNGQLLVDGKATHVDNAFKARVGYLPEAVAFPENLSGKQLLRFFARARGMPNSRVEEVLERVGLSAAARRSIRGYSRGMRQRLGLGAAMISQPALLVLDEPTGGLDQEGLGVLWSVLAEWRAQGRMVVISTHDLSLMEHRVDHMCLFKAGRLITEGSPASLRQQAAIPVRVDFDLAPDLGAQHAFAAKVGATNGCSGLQIQANMASLQVSAEQLLAVIDLTGAVPGAVTGVRVVEPGLDVVYDELLKRAS